MSDADPRPEPTVEPPVVIRVRPDGSYKVYGPVRVVDVDDHPYELADRRKTDPQGERIKLCRCGTSKDMPFCDDSHVVAGFSSCPRVDDPPSTAPETGLSAE